MKKIVPLLLSLVIIFAFAGCSSNDEPVEDTTVDLTVSTSEKETSEKVEVTEEQGSTASSATTEKKTTTKKADTTKKQTTAPTTEEKTTKRKIRLNVKYPYYQNKETVVNIEYKTAKDKKYIALVEDEKITLDGVKTLSYDFDKNLVGDVDIRITIDDVELLKNDFVVSGRDRELNIELVAGAEILEGGWD